MLSEINSFRRSRIKEKMEKKNGKNGMKLFKKPSSSNGKNGMKILKIPCL